MAAGQDSEVIIATLEEAKVKLGEAQRHTFAGLTRLGKIRSAIEFTLGRFGRGNPVITLLRQAEKSIKDRAVEINGLSARVDKAIAEIREAAGGGGSAPSPDPASSDIEPASRFQKHPVVAGDTPVLPHNSSRSVFGRKLEKLSKHITDRDLTAARRELNGEVVARKADGTPWDHVHEVRDAQNGMMNVIQQSQRRLGDSRLDAATRSQLEADLSRASKMLDYSEKFVPRR